MFLQPCFVMIGFFFSYTSPPLNWCQKWFLIVPKSAVYIHKFSSVTQSCLTLCDPMDCSMLGFPVLHQHLELAQTHVHQVSDIINDLSPLSSSSPLFNLSPHQDLFQWVSSSHQVAKVLELQLQHQSFQWIFKALHKFLLKTHLSERDCSPRTRSKKLVFNIHATLS